MRLRLFSRESEMDLKTKTRCEQLFTAELLLRRVYLHLMHSEHLDRHAVFTVAVRHQEIVEEGEKLRRQMRKEKHNQKGRGRNARGRREAKIS